jgi:uncharacterized membrane protein YhiD involved in acid resistance
MLRPHLPTFLVLPCIQRQFMLRLWSTRQRLRSTSGMGIMAGTGMRPTTLAGTAVMAITDIATMHMLSHTGIGKPRE